MGALFCAAHYCECKVMQSPILRISLLFVLAFTVVPSVFAEDDPYVIQQVEDFSRLGEELEQRRLPLVLMFSSEHCPYCQQMESDFLIPMQISGDYVDRALIRKIEIGYGSTVRDFDGSRVAADELAERYGISVTPTLVFLDGKGSQLARKQVGLTTPDYFGGYLDDSIATARDMLRRTRPLRVGLGDGPAKTAN